MLNLDFWKRFIQTPRKRLKFQGGRKIEVTQLGLSTGKIVRVRHLNFRAMGRAALTQ